MSISIVDTPSTHLRYTESRAFIKAPASPGYTDSMVGKLGYVEYKVQDHTWYFREEGQAERRRVQFNQIAFVPMLNDKILVWGPGIPPEYHYDQIGRASCRER